MDRDVIYAQIDTSREILTYEQFRTGLTFTQVYYMIWKRSWKRRKGVLGKWHEIKKAMYSEYTALYADQLGG